MLTDRARRAVVRPTGADTLASVHRALRVLEVIHRHSGGTGLPQIRRETGLPTAHLSRSLGLLTREGAIGAVGPRAWTLGPGTWDPVPEGDPEADPGGLAALLARIRDSVGAAVYLSRYEDGEVTVPRHAAGPNTPTVEEWVGFRFAAHASAVGKCLLTQLGHEDRRDHLARHRVCRFTRHTITDERALLRHLDTRSPRAPVLDLQEYALGTLCAAVPLRSGPAAECLALSLPLSRAHRLGDAAGLLQGEAAAVLLALLLAGEEAFGRTGAC
ncbi:IclR family transcriptional regulator [Streptomyces sp. BI20]|uniref:IclR family transcriptional regulator n=1 Tax=Streptomyces sp. BI20 TaxID=3403460 RepID=UPI003C75C41B